MSSGMDVGSGTDGGFTIGAAGDYLTVTLFEADIAAQLTGDLHGLHLAEETAISAFVTFDTDTNTHTLFLTAESGAEISGVAYENETGARIQFGTADRIKLDETNSGDLALFEISKIALDISGAANLGVDVVDGGDSGLLLLDRLLIKGDADSVRGVSFGGSAGLVVTSRLQNSIIYGIGDSSDAGIMFNYFGATGIVALYNNTVIGNSTNVRFAVGSGSLTLVMKNMLAQAASVTDDYEVIEGPFALDSAKNVSEDATSPDAAYRSKDMHTGAATVFKNYAGDDYRLDSGGDVTNLAILDDGENLFGSGVTEDIQGQARDNGTPFWIGASHIAAAPPAGVTKHNQGLLLGVY